MGDNGEVKLSGAEKPILDTGGSGTIKKEGEKKENLLATGDQIKPEQRLPPQPPTDFKVCEVWIRNGRIMIDAPQEFWNDRARARGLLLYCDDIVREAKMNEEKKIIPAKGSLINFVRNFKRKK